MLKNILRYGYTPTQIVSFLSRKYPDLKPFIDQAENYGYDAANILQFIQKKGPQITGYNYEEKPVSDAPLIARFDHMRNRNSAGMKKLAKFLGAGAALGAGLYSGLGYLSSVAGAYDFSGLGQNKAPTPPQAPIPGESAAPGQAPIEQEMIPESSIMQAMQQEEEPDILGELGLSEHAQTMLRSGNAPDIVAKYMRTHEMKTPEGKAIQKRYGDDLERILTENTNRLSEQLSEQPQRDVGLPTYADITPSAYPSVREPIQEQKPIEQEEQRKQPASFAKGDIVSTKSGEVGRVIDSKKNFALVNIDNKRKKVPLSELKKVEEEPSEMGVELEEGFTPPSRKLKSALVNGMTYNADTKELVVKFNSGAVYLYEDVPMEAYKQFSEGADTCTTRGKNEFGCWWPGKNPTLGGSFSRRIRNAGYKYTRLK